MQSLKIETTGHGHVGMAHMHPNGFLSRDSQGGSPEIVLVWTPGTLRVHTSQLRPPIGTRYKANF
jgi:hypothetical protein